MQCLRSGFKYMYLAKLSLFRKEIVEKEENSSAKVMFLRVLSQQKVCVCKIAFHVQSKNSTSVNDLYF